MTFRVKNIDILKLIYGYCRALKYTYKFNIYLIKKI